MMLDEVIHAAITPTHTAASHLCATVQHELNVQIYIHPLGFAFDLRVIYQRETKESGITG